MGAYKRFSEDIDFKASVPAGVSGAQQRKQRSSYREQALSALTAADFNLIAVKKGNESRFFSADPEYQRHFQAGPGLRPYIRIELSFLAPALQPADQPIQSLIAQFEQKPPEGLGFSLRRCHRNGRRQIKRARLARLHARTGNGRR